MQNTWNKHGENSFRIELVEQVVESKLLEAEQTYLDEHVGKSNCMNIAKDATCPPSWKGKRRIHTQETAAKISVTITKLWKDPNYRNKMKHRRPGMLGKKQSDKQIEMMRNNNPAKRPEVRKKLSEAQKRRWQKEEVGVAIRSK